MGVTCLSVLPVTEKFALSLVSNSNSGNIPLSSTFLFVSSSLGLFGQDFVTDALIGFKFYKIEDGDMANNAY
ncbi:hypothetical protein C0J52_06964 [Blattella germanica]|nr:hypothetical protein C0J52_06964 [Blattella germanica]